MSYEVAMLKKILFVRETFLQIQSHIIVYTQMYIVVPTTYNDRTNI